MGLRNVRNGVPFCLDATSAVALVEDINRSIKDNATGATSLLGQTLLVVVGLPKSREDSDECPYIVWDGERQEVQDHISIWQAAFAANTRFVTTITMANCGLLNWGAAYRSGPNDQELVHKVQMLAVDIGAFANRAGRNYGLVFLSPHHIMAFHNDFGVYSWAPLLRKTVYELKCYMAV